MLIFWQLRVKEANGLLLDDGNGLVPASQLPSYVDDVFIVI